MSRLKNRRIKIRIVGREAKDPLRHLEAIEKAFQPKDIEIEIGEDDRQLESVADEQLEQNVVDKARERLEELAKETEEASAQGRRKTKKKSKRKGKKCGNETAGKRRSIRRWLKGIAKEGYRITVKSLFEAILDKSQPM